LTDDIRNARPENEGEGAPPRIEHGFRVAKDMEECGVVGMCSIEKHARMTAVKVKRR
jgi:hypothetical protein